MNKGASFGAMVLVLGGNNNVCQQMLQDVVSGVRVGVLPPSEERPAAFKHGWSLILDQGSVTRGIAQRRETFTKLVLDALAARP